MLKLKSTGETCFEVQSLVTGGGSWPSDYRRVCIVGKVNRIQIVHKSKLKAV